MPVKPSPNLPEIQSIYWYPSTCFFEGTVLSEGRGTDNHSRFLAIHRYPKTCINSHPTDATAPKNPKLKGQVCYGWNLSRTPNEVLKKVDNQIQLKYLLKLTNCFPIKTLSFFLSSKKENIQPTDYFFNKLAGNAALMQQIKEGKTEDELAKVGSHN